MIYNERKYRYKLPFLDKYKTDSKDCYIGTYEYECQSCGKIYTIESGGELEIDKQCECGGKLYLIFMSYDYEVGKDLFEESPCDDLP